MMVWFGLIGIVASIRCCNIALPAIGWSDLGRDDLIRDPSPAAKITTDTFILFKTKFRNNLVYNGILVNK